MSDTLHHMMMFLLFSTTALIAIAAFHAMSIETTSHDDHVELDKSERDAWYELVATYHSD
jgi:hypothetical protein